jgi:hypothetical protein
VEHDKPEAPAQADKLRCWPWSHQWSKWNTYSGGKLVKITDALGLPIREGDGIAQHVIGDYENQRRECQRCGKAELREIRT